MQRSSNGVVLWLLLINLITVCYTVANCKPCTHLSFDFPYFPVGSQIVSLVTWVLRTSEGIEQGPCKMEGVVSSAILARVVRGITWSRSKKGKKPTPSKVIKCSETSLSFFTHFNSEQITPTSTPNSRLYSRTYLVFVLAKCHRCAMPLWFHCVFEPQRRRHARLVSIGAGAGIRS